MIVTEEHFKIFEKTKFSRKEISAFLDSVEKSIILSFLGSAAYPKLLELEEKYQWPILKEINNPKLEIYRGADPGLLKRFINSINDEMEVRIGRKSRRISEKDSWIALRILIYDRIELYKKIFDCTKEDIRKYEKIAAEHAKILTKEEKNKAWKFLGKVAIGAGIAAVAGTTGICLYSKYKKSGKK